VTEAGGAGLQQLMARKYRIDLMFIKPIRSLQAALRRGQPPAKEAAVAITPGARIAPNRKLRQIAGRWRPGKRMRITCPHRL
jgi:hypothetical protein